MVDLLANLGLPEPPWPLIPLVCTHLQNYAHEPFFYSTYANTWGVYPETQEFTQNQNGGRLSVRDRRRTGGVGLWLSVRLGPMVGDSR
jgi:hypothetical protein